MKIELNKVIKTINGITVLNNIDYTFVGGNIYGLKGKNGSGKTMLMRAISGLMKPTQGSIFINNKELYKDIEVPDSVGVLIERPSYLQDYTAFDNLKILSDLKQHLSKEEIEKTLSEVGLAEYKKLKVKKYSLGMKQRLGIAMAILGKPEIIILDEPINAIDENGVSEIKEIIQDLKADNRIIILACHDKEELEYLADTIIEVRNGYIVS